MRNPRVLTLGVLTTLSVLLVSAADLANAQPSVDRGCRHVDRFITLFDTDGDGKVNLAEITDEQKRLFGAVDVDGDGNLSVDVTRSWRDAAHGA